MNDERLEPPATPDEEAAARRLAAALEGEGETADDTIAAARLLQAVGAGARDEVAERRLRRALVHEAGRARRMRRVRALAAAAILLAAGATALQLSRHRPESLSASLEEREARAREAVARLMVAEAPSASRVGDLTDALRGVRLDTLWQSRLSTLAGSSAGRTAPSPTPGGPVS